MAMEVYSLIRDGLYDEAAAMLRRVSEDRPKSRPLLSLLAYCAYGLEHFAEAAEIYRQLIGLCPENADYRLYYAQCLFRDGAGYDEVEGAVATTPEGSAHVRQLKLAVAYETDDVQTYRRLLNEQTEASQLQKCANLGCLLYKEGEFDKARRKFMDAMELCGYQGYFAYACALCSQELGELGPALQYCSAIAEHSEITDNGRLPLEAHASRETFVVEALNLKLAIEWEMQNVEAARETLKQMPLREDADLDAVTLYNAALLNWQDDHDGAVEKLEHIVQNPPFSSGAVETLLLLYCHPSVSRLQDAASFLSDRSDLVSQYVRADVVAFVEALTLRDAAPDDCLLRLTELQTRLRKQLLRELRETSDATRRAANEALESYVSGALFANDTVGRILLSIVVMSVGHLLYEQQRFGALEKLFHQTADLCGEHLVWRSNFAHALFVQGETKYDAAIPLYESIVQEHVDHILDVTPVVLANLCVAYIMTNQNDLAEDLMRRVEEQEAEGDGLHLCTINLVIGTLYCSKGNFDFGISRVVKSFDPVEEKLDVDTWYYAKTCFVSLLENVTKCALRISDERYDQILQFLSLVVECGQSLSSDLRLGSSSGEWTIAREAQVLVRAFEEIL